MLRVFLLLWNFVELGFNSQGWCFVFLVCAFKLFLVDCFLIYYISYNNLGLISYIKFGFRTGDWSDVSSLKEGSTIMHIFVDIRFHTVIIQGHGNSLGKKRISMDIIVCLVARWISLLYVIFHSFQGLQAILQVCYSRNFWLFEGWLSILPWHCGSCQERNWGTWAVQHSYTTIRRPWILQTGSQGSTMLVWIWTWLRHGYSGWPWEL